MATGLEKHRARQTALSALGKQLARRANRRCELCQRGEAPLRPTEIGTPHPHPELSRAILACPQCAGALAGDGLCGAEWRHLETRMWSEVHPVKAAVITLLVRLSEANEEWAGDALDALYIEPEVRALLDGLARTLDP